MLILEGKIHDGSELCSRIVFLDLGCLVDNLVDALVKVAASFYTFDIHSEFHFANCRGGRVDLETLALNFDSALSKRSLTALGQSVGHSRLPTSLEGPNLLVDVFH